MEYSEIRRLAEKYWACETTPQEEQLLRDFFSGHHEDIPYDLKETSALFGFWAEESAVKTEDPEWEEALRAIPQQEARPRGIVYRLRPLLKYAAILVIAAGTYYFTARERQAGRRQATAAVTEDSYRDPQRAFEETRQALMLVAANLNKGKEEMQKLSRFSEAQEIVSQSADVQHEAQPAK